MSARRSGDSGPLRRRALEEELSFAADPDPDDPWDGSGYSPWYTGDEGGLTTYELGSLLAERGVDLSPAEREAFLALHPDWSGTFDELVEAVRRL